MLCPLLMQRFLYLSKITELFTVLGYLIRFALLLSPYVPIRAFNCPDKIRSLRRFMVSAFAEMAERGRNDGNHWTGIIENIEN
jgi:hypothetical protein